MWEIYERLRDDAKVSDYAVAKACGFGQSALTSWKKGRSTPKADKMQKIAEYFGVSVDYLMGKDEPAPDPTLARLIADFQTLNDEQKKRALAYIRGLRDAYDAFLASADR